MCVCVCGGGGERHIRVPVSMLPHVPGVASFLGPAQLFVACSTEKRGEPGIFSHVSMM